MATCLDQLREEAAGPLAHLADPDYEKYREAAHRCVYGEPEPAGSRSCDRLFESQPEARPSRPGDYLFGNGDDPVFRGTAPAPAPEPATTYAHSQRFQEAAAAQRPDPEYDVIFSGRPPEAVTAPVLNPDLAHLFNG